MPGMQALTYLEHARYRLFLTFKAYDVLFWAAVGGYCLDSTFL
jgi:hypothetical protein